MNSRKCPMMEIYGHKWPWVQAHMLKGDRYAWTPMWQNGMVFETPPNEMYVDLAPRYVATSVRYLINRNWSNVPMRKLWMIPVRRDG